MTLKFNGVVEVVKVHVRAKLHQAKCSGSLVINSAQNISGMDQAIDRWKMGLSTMISTTFNGNNWVNFGTLTKNDLDLSRMTLKFNRVLEVVEVHVRAKVYQAKFSCS